MTVPRPDRSAPDQNAPEHAILATVLDTAVLSELVGQPALALRLRYKPGLSVVASWADPEGTPTGWVQVATPEHADKIDKAVRRAGRTGVPVQRASREGLEVISGPTAGDPELVKPLAKAGDLVGDDGTLALGVRALRHNPLRRLVLRRSTPTGTSTPSGCGAPSGAEVVRVTADEQPDLSALWPVLEDSGVPVSRPVRARPFVSRWPWLPGEDLAALAERSRPGSAYRSGFLAAAHDAGVALARLHSLDTETLRTTLPVGPSPSRQRAQLRRSAHDLYLLDPALGDRLSAVLGRLGEVEPVQLAVLHGDFSADQVIVGEDGRVQIIDLDRVGLGDPRTDLASCAAAELVGGGTGLPVTSEVLAAYAQARGGSADLDPTLVAQAVLTRVLEPLRGADPAWREGVGGLIDLAERVLTEGTLTETRV